MTSTHTSPAAAGISVDRRPGPRSAALALLAGGVLFAVGNALHPLEHSDAATTAPTWAAAHLIFALGALLMVGGLPALAPRLAASRTGVAGLLLTAVGMVFVVGSAYVEVYVAPLVGHEMMERVEATAGLWNALTLLTYLVGPVLVAVIGLWSRALPVAGCVAVLAAQLVTVAGPALGVLEGYWLIPATVVFGLGFAVLGGSVLRDTPVAA